MARKKKGNKINGWLILDKPLGITSTQAIGKLRRLYSPQKIGHAGTLDPLATGVLPIAMGEATKTIPFVQDASKTYEFSVTWGEQRSTDDAEGEVIATSDNRPTTDDIKNALSAFLGEIDQIPPQFSAIKIDGKRAYDLARAGENVDIKSRKITVHSLELISNNGSTADLCMNCSKGTYVRSIARDLAEALNTKAYVSKLRRTHVGSFNQDNAFSLAILGEMDDSATLSEALLPIDSALDDILALEISEKEAADLKNGRALTFISTADAHRLNGLSAKSDDIIIAKLGDKPIALIKIDKNILKPVRVFNIDNK